eukprot:3230373-Rhodomonas_salina.1
MESRVSHPQLLRALRLHHPLLPHLLLAANQDHSATQNRACPDAIFVSENSLPLLRPSAASVREVARHRESVLSRWTLVPITRKVKPRRTRQVDVVRWV